MDLDTATEELYVIAPASFVRRRGELASEAQRSGEKATASAIKKLHKPTLGAWLANLLTRQRADQIEKLLRLGESLRTAQLHLAGKELRQLAQQRHEVITTLVAEARGMAREAGSPVNDDAARELEITLSAALADPDAAKELRSGRLVSGLSYSGFGPLEGVVAPAAPATARSVPHGADRRAAKPTSGDDEGRRHRREVAERAVRDAETTAADAQHRLAETTRVSADLHDQLGRLQEQLKDLDEQLTVAKSAVTEGEKALRSAEKERGEAEQRVQAAGKRVGEAAAALERLLR